VLTARGRWLLAAVSFSTDHVSSWRDRDIECPHCGAGLTVTVAIGLHITRLPQVRDQILEGEFHRFDCTACRKRIEVRQPLVYTDFERGHWIEVRPDDDIASWQELAPAAAAIFDRAVVHGAPILRSHVETFTVRLVFGYAELREKVLLFEAGLDDRAVECLKLLAIRNDPSRFGFHDRLLVQRIAGDELELGRHRANEVIEVHTVRASRDELAAARVAAEPVIQPPFTDPFVSINRAIGAYARIGA
jgi:hypothetical protein